MTPDNPRPEVDPFAIGRQRQGRCRLGVPCVMFDCQQGIPPEPFHFFAPDGSIYPPRGTDDR